MTVHFSSAFCVLSCLVALVGTQSLPYNPATIFLTSTNTGIAYVFLPSSDQDAAHQLSYLNISATISTSNLSLTAITSNLPFQTNGSAAFIPSISTSGKVSVYAGSCTSGVAQLWTLDDRPSSTQSAAVWRANTLTAADDVKSVALTGANFLSTAFSFSNYAEGNATNTDTYIFGGMCPNDSANVSTWQSSGTYSNHMIRISPDSSSYILDFTSSRGPPVAEAGFTITGLTPTYFNNSKPVTQQQNYVLIGGHTRAAFINMSQVAIWSLPEETWSFITVDAPATSNPNTELAVKSVAASVDSRSGHTSVLTEDGTKLIVLGGWVGDTAQAADPQLAILELGTGFGGTGDWKWTIPSHQPGGGGMFGHAAVMLPGNVMLVLGGYNISSSSAAKRDSAPAAPAMFFNATTLSWISNYTSPSFVAATLSDAEKTSASAKSKAESKKIALGVGLGFGLTAILVALVVFCWHTRRQRLKLEDERDRHIDSLAAYSPNSEMDERSGDFSWSRTRWNRTRGRNKSAQDATTRGSGYDNPHGFTSDIPPPPRQITRKPLHSRSARGRYQPTPSAFDLGASSSGRTKSNSLGTAGPIHPIYEADEDDRISNASDNGIGFAMGDPSFTPTSAKPKGHSDPFHDPPVVRLSSPRHRDESESPARSREREIQEWVSDWAAADALMSSQARSHSSAGRISPSRRAQMVAASNVSSVSGEEESGRTTSNLSERSVAISAMTISRSGSSSQGRSRSNSLRGFIATAMSPFSATILSTNAASTADDKGPPPGSSSSSNSFTTAHTSFGTLQAEAEGLLPRPDDGVRSYETSPTQSAGDSGSPSKSKPLVRRGGWLGSIRRAIAGSGEGSSPAHNNHGARTPSPIRIGETLQPRRTVSAGATLWRRKQGKADWEDSENLSQTPAGGHRSNTLTGYGPAAPLTEGDADEDWDIERAVENRVVQVMFSVPKERLRVVNHDFANEDKSEASSLRSKKGSGKSTNEVPMLDFVDEKGEEREIPESDPIDEKGRGNEVEGKPRGRVQDIVEKIEGMNTPESSPRR